MKKSVILILVLHFMAAAAFSETLSDYQEKIQRIFIKEASNKYAFTKAVQTARLLGYLEFMESENFSKFYQCFGKNKDWEYLSAQKRQTLLNECRGFGRSLSGMNSPQPTFSVSPAQNQKQEQEINALRKDMNELRSMVEKMSSDMRNNQDQLLEALQSMPSRVPSATMPPGEPSFQ